MQIPLGVQKLSEFKNPKFGSQAYSTFLTSNNEFAP